MTLVRASHHDWHAVDQLPFFVSVLNEVKKLIFGHAVSNRLRIGNSCIVNDIVSNGPATVNLLRRVARQGLWRSGRLGQLQHLSGDCFAECACLRASPGPAKIELEIFGVDASAIPIDEVFQAPVVGVDLGEVQLRGWTSP